MGTTFTKLTMTHLWKEDEPYCFDDCKYDPQFGFNGERKEKQMRATEDEMNSAGLMPNERDLCAHIMIRLRGCQAYYRPVGYPCKGLEKELYHCREQEHIDDWKDFEREKRLNQRERRLRQSS